MINMSIWDDDDRDSKRTLGTRDKEILWLKAKKRCENPACGKEIDFIDMEAGHGKAWSKGGRTTMKNSICLCHGCNKRQGTDTWATFLKKQGIEDKSTTMKKSLDTLSVSQLKSLAEKHHIKVKGSVEESWGDSYRKPPSKSQYISKLSKVITDSELNPNQVESKVPEVHSESKPIESQQIDSKPVPVVSKAFASKDSLKKLSIKQLKILAKNHNITVRGSVEEGFLEDTIIAPTKGKYIKKLIGVVSEEELKS